MKAIESIKTRLLDVELPTAPPDAIDYTGIALIIITVILVIVTVVFVLRSHQFRNKRLLTRLEHKLNSSLLTPREASYQLAEILKSAQQTRRLTISDNTSPEWKQFCLQLSESRYQQNESNKQQIIKLIGDARYWLKASKS